MAKKDARGADDGERRDYKRVRSYLGGRPPIESFRLFVEIAKHIRTGRIRSLRSLSRKMGFSETFLSTWLPTFAEQIQLYEHDLIRLPAGGQPLVQLTDGAQRLLRDVQDLLGYYGTVVSQAGRVGEEITCGTWQWLMNHVFNKAAARFAEEQVGRVDRTGLRFLEYGTDRMLEDLAQGVIDLGFGAPEKDLREMYSDSLEVFETEVQATSELVAIAPKGHAWARKVAEGPVDCSELVRETLCVILYDREKQFANFRARGLEKGRLIVVDNYASVLGMVSEAAKRTPPAGLVGIVPRFGVQARGGTAYDSALDVFDVTGIWNPENRFAFWVRKSWKPHPELEKFIACVVEVANDVWYGGPTANPSAAPNRKRARRRTK